VDYIDVANAALTKPEALADWEALFVASCQVCSNGFATASRIQARGDTVTGGELSATNIQLSDVTPGQATVVITGAVDAAEVKDPTGEIVESFPAIEAVTIVYTASRSKGAWQMTSGQVVQ
jgi:hypothetical protein